MTSEEESHRALISAATFVNPKGLFLYVPCPYWVLHDKRLTSQAKLLMARLLGYSYYDPDRCTVRQGAFVRVGKLGEELGRSPRAIQRAIRCLEEYRLLRVERRVNRSSTYLPLVPTGAKKTKHHRLLISKWTFRGMKLRASAKLTYAAISQAAGPLGIATISYGEIGNRTGTARTTVIDDVDELDFEGWIEKARINDSNTYGLVPRSEMVGHFRADADPLIVEETLVAGHSRGADQTAKPVGSRPTK